jgi:hypothetical protein
LTRAARFILSGKLLCRKPNGAQGVRRDAFLPRGNPLETSVILHDDPVADLPWTIGQKMAAACKPDASGARRQLHGVADVSDMDVVTAKLQLSPQPSKISKRHANIVGWSSERVKQQDAALTLAEAAVVTNF